MSSPPSRSRSSTRLDDYTKWTLNTGDTLFIPSPGLSGRRGLVEDRSEYDITLKIFFLPGWESTADTDADSSVSSAVQLVLDELAVSKIDLAIASFTGITFDADDDDEEDEDDHQAGSGESTQNGTGNGNGKDSAQKWPLEAALCRFWASFEQVHLSGKVDRLGVSELGAGRLGRFMSHFPPRSSSATSNHIQPQKQQQQHQQDQQQEHRQRDRTALTVQPVVNQLNVRDCCVVPKRLLDFARDEKIELLTHNDCTNIMPPGTLRSLLGGGGNNRNDNDSSNRNDGTGGGTTSSEPNHSAANNSHDLSASPPSDNGNNGADEDSRLTVPLIGVQILTDGPATEIDGRGNGTGDRSDRLRGNVVPRYVVKYTAVLKNQGVVENKGYFVAADLEP